MYLKYICILEKAMRKTTKARSETSPGSTPVLKADLLGYTIQVSLLSTVYYSRSPSSKLIFVLYGCVWQSLKISWWLPLRFCSCQGKPHKMLTKTSHNCVRAAVRAGGGKASTNTKGAWQQLSPKPARRHPKEGSENNWGLGNKPSLAKGGQNHFFLTNLLLPLVTSLYYTLQAIAYVVSNEGNHFPAYCVAKNQVATKENQREEHCWSCCNMCMISLPSGGRWAQKNYDSFYFLPYIFSQSP